MTTNFNEPLDDRSGRTLAVVQIGMGSLVSAYGQLSGQQSDGTPNFLNPVAWGAAAFFWLLQWGMTHRAWQARMLWRRGFRTTALTNLGAVILCAWVVHAALLQSLSVADDQQQLHGFNPDMLACVFVLLPLLEPLSYWTVALLTEPATNETPVRSAVQPARRQASPLEHAAKLASIAGITMAPTATAQPAQHVSDTSAPSASVQERTADAVSARRTRIADARRLHLEGLTQCEIGRRLGVHRNTVRTWLKLS